MTRLPLLCLPLPISLAAIVAATPAVAQAPAPPAAPTAPGAAPPAPGFPPPPPPGAPGSPAPDSVRPPPPPRPGGPTVILDHNGGFTHVDVHCAPAETTQACSDLAARLYDRLNGTVQAK